MSDLIDRQAALDCVTYDEEYTEECIKALPSTQPLSEADLTELEGRFGKYVRYVVEDMISGKGERWKT